MSSTSSCPECGQSNLYASGEMPPGITAGANLLPGLENVATHGKFIVVVCEDCGLMRLFASPAARSKLSASRKWRKL